MKIVFCLSWWPGSGPAARAFKLKPAYELFQEYANRLTHYGEVSIKSLPEKTEKLPALRRWLCDRGKGARVLSSEDHSRELEKIRDSGIRTLEIIIGGPDGFPPSALQALHPDLRWSFGPLTLPHELAAVVAAEQLYRSWTILRRLPYHGGH